MFIVRCCREKNWKTTSQTCLESNTYNWKRVSPRWEVHMAATKRTLWPVLPRGMSSPLASTVSAWQVCGSPCPVSDGEADIQSYGEARAFHDFCRHPARFGRLWRLPGQDYGGEIHWHWLSCVHGCRKVHHEGNVTALRYRPRSPPAKLHGRILQFSLFLLII